MPTKLVSNRDWTLSAWASALFTFTVSAMPSFPSFLGCSVLYCD